MLKKFFATLVVTLLVLSFATSAFAATGYYGDYFDIVLESANAERIYANEQIPATRGEIASMMHVLISNTSPNLFNGHSSLTFKDTSDYRFRDLARAGIICGYEDGTFRPQNPVTREEAAVLLLRLQDKGLINPENKGRLRSFYDVEESRWSYPYICRATRIGFIKGTGSRYFEEIGRNVDCFDPTNYVLVKEFVTMWIGFLGPSNNPGLQAINEVYGLEFINATNTNNNGNHNNNYHNNGYYGNYNNNSYNNGYYGNYNNNSYNNGYYGNYNNNSYNNNSYNNGYYEDDILERPSVNTGNVADSTTSNSNSTNSSKRPERPKPELDESNTSSTTTSDGSRPSRPVYDTTTTNNTSTEVESSSVESDSSRPARPIY